MVCVLCGDIIHAFAIGKCNHLNCGPCTTKLRRLFGIRKCQICNAKTDDIVFTWREDYIYEDLIRIYEEQMIPERDADDTGGGSGGGGSSTETPAAPPPPAPPVHSVFYQDYMTQGQIIDAFTKCSDDEVDPIRLRQAQAAVYQIIGVAKHSPSPSPAAGAGSLAARGAQRVALGSAFLVAFMGHNCILTTVDVIRDEAATRECSALCMNMKGDGFRLELFPELFFSTSPTLGFTMVACQKLPDDVNPEDVPPPLDLRGGYTHPSPKAPEAPEGGKRAGWVPPVVKVGAMVQVRPSRRRREREIKITHCVLILLLGSSHMYLSTRTHSCVCVLCLLPCVGVFQSPPWMLTLSTPTLTPVPPLYPSPTPHHAFFFSSHGAVDWAHSEASVDTDGGRDGRAPPHVQGRGAPRGLRLARAPQPTPLRTAPPARQHAPPPDRDPHAPHPLLFGGPRGSPRHHPWHGRPTRRRCRAGGGVRAPVHVHPRRVQPPHPRPCRHRAGAGNGDEGAPLESGRPGGRGARALPPS